jgi:hypothetical protein
VQRCAQGEGGVGIDGAVALLDELDDSLLVDDDVGAKGPLIGIVFDVVALQDAIGFEHFAVHVAEQREGQADLLGEDGVGRRAVHADAKDFGIGSVDSAGGDSSLDRLKLLGSTLGEGEDVDGKVDVFLAAKVAELDGLPMIAKKSEIRGGVTDLESHPGHLRFFDLLSYGWCSNRSR